MVVIVGEQQISGIRQLSACHPPCALKTKFNDDLLSCAAIRTLRGASFRRLSPTVGRHNSAQIDAIVCHSGANQPSAANQVCDGIVTRCLACRLFRGFPLRLAVARTQVSGSGPHSGRSATSVSVQFADALLGKPVGGAGAS